MTPFERACARWRPEIVRAVPDASDDFHQELTIHVAQRWVDAIARGVPEDDADRAARTDLQAWIGVPAPRRPERSHPFTGTGLDWRFALRMIRERPSFAASAAILIALAVTVTGAAFAILYGVIGRALPYPEAARLVSVWESTADGRTQISAPNAADLKATRVFDATALFMSGVGTFSGATTVERVGAVFVEPVMWTLLGASPVAGRLLSPDDAGKPLAVISHRLWQAQFGGAAEVVGRTFTLSGSTITVVGVLPPDFQFELPVARTFRIDNPDIWQPFDPSEAVMQRRDVSTYQLLARLSPSVLAHQAQSTASDLATALAQRYPESNRDRTFIVEPLRETVVGDSRRALWASAGALVVLVLAALANLGGLALARASGRRDELTTRVALGASRMRLLRQLLIEPLPIVGAALIAGVLAARTVTRALVSSTALELPRQEAIRFDAPVWFAMIGVAVCALLVLALLPLAAGRLSSLTPATTRVIGNASRSRRTLVTAEIALALVLSTTAAFVSLTLLKLLDTDPGFETRGRISFRASAYARTYPDKPSTMAFYGRLTDSLRAVPGVTDVAIGSSLPLTGQFSGVGVISDPAGLAPVDRLPAGWQHVSPTYFDATGMRLISGRAFRPEEAQRDTHVSIISASLARSLFGTSDPIGRRIQIGGGTDWHEVVGVVGDVKHRSLTQSAEHRVYDLFGQHWGRTMFVVAATTLGEPGALSESLTRAVAALDPAVPVFEMATAEDRLGRSVALERLASAIAGAVALIALMLAAFGVHAIVACSVAERRREIGVRLALGATRWSVARLSVTEAGRLTVMGGVIGIAAAYGAARILATVLPGLEPSGAWRVIVWVAAVVAGATLTASLPAAHRASIINPARTLQDG